MARTPARSSKRIKNVVAYAEARAEEPPPAAAPAAAPAPAPAPAPEPAPVAAAEPAPAAAPAPAPAAAPAPVAELTAFPPPDALPSGDPDAPGPAPGVAPPGDSRSMRRGPEFALVYRHDTFVITATGRVGARGAWRAVEYGTVAAASHAYALEASRLRAEGYVDHRG